MKWYGYIFLFFIFILSFGAVRSFFAAIYLRSLNLAIRGIIITIFFVLIVLMFSIIEDINEEKEKKDE